MIEPAHPRLSLARQCRLVSISGSAYYAPVGSESGLNLALMRLIDRQFLESPWYGSRQMARHLRRQGHVVGHKRVRRLMAKMGFRAVYQRPRRTVPHPEHKIWPYLLRNVAINRPNHAWCADLTYIPMDPSAASWPRPLRGSDRWSPDHRWQPAHWPAFHLGSTGGQDQDLDGRGAAGGSAMCSSSGSGGA